MSLRVETAYCTRLSAPASLTRVELLSSPSGPDGVAHCGRAKLVARLGLIASEVNYDLDVCGRLLVTTNEPPETERCFDVHGYSADWNGSTFYAARVVQHDEVAIICWSGECESDMFDV